MDDIKYWGYQVGEPVEDGVWMWFYVPVLASWQGVGEGWLWVDFFEFEYDPEWIKLEVTWNPHMQDISEVWRFSKPGFFGDRTFTPVAKGEMFHALPLPQPITNVGTIYMRYQQFWPFTESHFGLSAMKTVPADPVSGLGGSPNSWDDLVINGRWTIDGRLELFDGQDFYRVSTDLGAYPQVEQGWCEFWIVIDIPKGIYRTYARGPGMSYSVPEKEPHTYEPRLLLLEDPESGVGLLEEANFKSPVDALHTFIMASTDNYYEGGDHEWDSIYVDVTGVNLYRPESPLCLDCGEILFLHLLGFYPIHLNGWADTGDWLGWVYAAEYPWVYSNTWKNWLWVSTDPRTPGAVWAFVAMGVDEE